MKKFIAALLCLIMLFPSSPLLSEEESIDEHAKNADALYRTGAGAQDGAYTSLAMSMLGWGLGLAIGIGILAAVLHQSKSAHETHAHDCD